MMLALGYLIINHAYLSRRAQFLLPIDRPPAFILGGEVKGGRGGCTQLVHGRSRMIID